MPPATDNEKRFVAYLEGLVASEDRAALAALRRGLGKRPGEVAEVHPHVVPRLPRQATPWEEDAYYLVASLFAAHQLSWHPTEDGHEPTNLGASFARLSALSKSGSIEARFVALLNAHPTDLGQHLRHAVALLKAKEIPIDWAQLLHDLRFWDVEGRPVQRAWARAFWANTDAVQQPEDEAKEE